jgi:hypothetical protein
MKNYSVSVAACLLLIAVAAASPSPAAVGEKPRAEEVVARHLESVGTAEARAATKSVLARGTVNATFRAPSTAQLSGRVIIASEGDKNLFGMDFENASSSQETFAFDGEEVTTGFVRPGVRSTLSDFILTHRVIVRHGLLGGTLSDAWPLLSLDDKKAKLEYGDTKSLGGRPAHVLKYVPRGGSDLQISLFFDAETFRHVRTEYYRAIPAPMGVSPNSAVARLRESRYKMVEDFSDFRREGALVLPHAYNILLEMDTSAGSFRAEWKLALVQFAFNHQFKPGSFNANAG